MLLQQMLTTPHPQQRIYVVGIANGGFLAQRLACDEPQLFRGVVAYASGLNAVQCEAPGRVPLLLIQGDADVIVPFAGGVNSAGVAFPGFVATAASWRARNGCADTPATSSFVAVGPSQQDDKYTVRVSDYAGGTRFSSWQIVNGNHFALPGTSAVIFGKALHWMMG